MNTMLVIYLFLWSMVFRFGHGDIHLPSQNVILKIDADVDTRSGPLKIGVVTWNMAERSPLRSDCNFLHDYDDCDVIALGLQECEDIRPRRREGRRLRKWRELRDSVYRKDFQCVREVKLGGLHLSLLIKKSKLRILKRAKTFAIPCGVGNILANKGAVGVILRLNNKKTIAFVNAHLAAHQEMVRYSLSLYNIVVKHRLFNVQRSGEGPKSELQKNYSSPARELAVVLGQTDRSQVQKVVKEVEILSNTEARTRGVLRLSAMLLFSEVIMLVIYLCVSVRHFH